MRPLRTGAGNRRRRRPSCGRGAGGPRGGERFSHGSGPGGRVGGGHEAGTAEGRHVDQAFKCSGEDRQSGCSGLGGGDPEALGTAGHGDVRRDEQVGAGVEAFDRGIGQGSEQPQARFAGGNAAKGDFLRPGPDDGEGDLRPKERQDLFGEPGGALSSDQPPDREDEGASRGKAEGAAFGGGVRSALDAGEAVNVDAVWDDAGMDTEAAGGLAGGVGADGDGTVIAEGAESRPEEGGVARKWAGDILAMEGHGRRGAGEGREERRGWREEGIAEVDHLGTPAASEAGESRPRDKERQPALAAPERNEAERAGVASGELSGELFHAADCRRKFAGDEEQHAPQ